MRIIRITTFLACLLLVSTQAFSQSEFKVHTIQLAAYNSYDQLVKNEATLLTNLEKVKFPSTQFNKESLFVQESGKWIKLFLVHGGSEGKEILSALKKRKYFKGTYHGPKILEEDLFFVTSRYETAVQLNKDLPEEYSAKGGSVAKKEIYKIQLGAFTEMKTNEYIAAQYGFGGSDDVTVLDNISHDFTTVNKKVCRRYFYGEYPSMAEAKEAKKQLEKSSKRKLMIVKK